jgi:hypothetical protein
MIRKSVKVMMFWLCVAGLCGLSACGDEEVENPEGENEGEVITTLNLRFMPVGGGEVVEAQFRDGDGPGGEAPTVSDIVLSQGVTYDLTLEVLNELESPAEDITEEIQEEAEEHQFFFTGDAAEGLLDISYADKESDYPKGNAEGEDLPVGLKVVVVASEAGSGSLVVTLKHLPPVNGVAVKAPSIGLGAGDTDIEVDFDVTVQ